MDKGYFSCALSEKYLNELKDSLERLIETKQYLLSNKEYHQAYIDTYLISKLDLKLNGYAYQGKDCNIEYIESCFDDEIERFKDYMSTDKDDIDAIESLEKQLGYSLEDALEKILGSSTDTKKGKTQIDLENILRKFINRLRQDHPDFNIRSLPYRRSEMLDILQKESELFKDMTTGNFDSFWKEQKICELKRGNWK